MTKLKSDKISFNDDDFLVEVNEKKQTPQNNYNITKNNNSETQDSSSESIIENAKKEADEIIRLAKESAEEEKAKILQQAKLNADEIINNTKSDLEKKRLNQEEECEKLLEDTKAQAEKIRTDEALRGYEEGYQDGYQKIREELEEKITGLDEFCASQFEIKEKIISSAKKDILSLISNISRKILLKESDGGAIDKIIQKTVNLFEKKENIKIVLSERYAKLLYEFQKNSLNEEIDFNFEDFKQYKNFDIVYNANFCDDTIIVENIDERFDASINSQLDILIKDIYENTNIAQLEIGEDEA